jgi:hypothetical protein
MAPLASPSDYRAKALGARLVPWLGNATGPIHVQEIEAKYSSGLSVGRAQDWSCQPEFLFDGGSRIANLLHSGLELGRRHAKLVSPIADFVVFVNVDADRSCAPFLERSSLIVWLLE